MQFSLYYLIDYLFHIKEVSWGTPPTLFVDLLCIFVVLRQRFLPYLLTCFAFSQFSGNHPTFIHWLILVFFNFWGFHLLLSLTRFAFLQFSGTHPTCIHWLLLHSFSSQVFHSPTFIDPNKISANQVIESLPNLPLNNTFPI